MSVWPSAGVGVAPNNLGGSSPFINPVFSTLTFLGTTTERISGLPTFEVPFPSDPKEYVVHVPYEVRADQFLAMEIDKEGPYGGHHAGESGFRPSKGGMLSFSREFARVPDSRNEFETFTYPVQIVTSGGSQPDTLTEIPTTMTSRVQFDYFRTDDITSIPLDKAPRAIVIDGTASFLHGWGSLVVGSEMLADDAVLRAWKGRIYERVQRFIEVRHLVDEV